LAGETLVFDLTLVGLNGDRINVTETTNDTIVDDEGGELNMTFDRYDPELAEGYGIEKYPSLIYNCEYLKLGQFNEENIEMDAIAKLTCVTNKGLPKDLCEDLGITVGEDGNLKTTDPTINEVLKSFQKLTQESCKPENSTVIQAFYSQDCDNCKAQKELLDKLDNDFGDYLNISYYCVGEEEYCQSHLAE
jgi:hypothetical protein